MILNPDGSPTEIEAVELSRRLLAALRTDSNDAGIAAAAMQLHGIAPGLIDGDKARIAFWLNVYNALLLDRLRVKPAGGNMLMHPRVFSGARYVIGGRTYSLNQIEHGVLRRNSRAPFPPLRPFRPSDERLQALPSHLDPRIHFALNCGARSCPPIRTYAAELLDEDLEAATTAYLRAETEVGADAITLPRLMKLYGRDFGGATDRVAFAAVLRAGAWSPRRGGSRRAQDPLRAL